MDKKEVIKTLRRIANSLENGEVELMRTGALYRSYDSERIDVEVLYKKKFKSEADPPSIKE